ncbi:MAG TPA: CBS domain-containing protein [Caulobacteraceae bacterium]|nr:CBS domain-containing protein [Caulobacteraceae bacterium]
MLISDLIKRKGRGVVSLPVSAELHRAAKLMASQGIGAIVVVNAAGGLEGLVAERDVVKAVTAGGRAVLRDKVDAWMRRRVPTAAPQAKVLEAIDLITAARTRHLPVVEDGKVIGVLSVGDLLKSRLDEKTEENLVLRDIARWPRAALA